MLSPPERVRAYLILREEASRNRQLSRRGPVSKGNIRDLPLLCDPIYFALLCDDCDIPGKQGFRPCQCARSRQLTGRHRGRSAARLQPSRYVPATVTATGAVAYLSWNSGCSAIPPGTARLLLRLVRRIFTHRPDHRHRDARTFAPPPPFYGRCHDQPGSRAVPARQTVPVCCLRW